MKPNPFLNRLGNGSSSCFVGFRCFGNTSCSFRVAFIWMHFPSFSFHLHASSFHCALISFHCPAMFISLVFISIHVPFMFIPMCIHVLSSSFHFAFMSFHFLSKVMEMAPAWPGNRVQQMVLAKILLMLSLKNPSNITPPKRHRESESELDAKCYGNCRKQGTTG